MEKKANSKKWVLWFTGSVVIITILWLLSHRIMQNWFCLDHIGVIGDSFGAVNALFSGFAFAGVIITIVMQARELELQRNEIKETKEVFTQQTFDNMFFQLLGTQQSIVDSLDLRKNEWLFRFN
ncbi:MAG: hypothetical protein ACI9JN_002765 [Bacteroidia bacterium]|jgi:hypothetical protein